MKILKFFFVLLFVVSCMLSAAVSNANGQSYDGEEDPNKKIIKSGL